MWDWLIDHWYVVWGGSCAFLILIGHIVFRRSPDSGPARVFYWFFSNLDPTPRAVAERNAQAVRSVILAGLGLVVIGAFILIVWLISRIDVIS